MSDDPYTWEKIDPCPRCGGRHENITFKPLERPIEGPNGSTYTYWAPCPRAGDPIVLKASPFTTYTITVKEGDNA